MWDEIAQWLVFAKHLLSLMFHKRHYQRQNVTQQTPNLRSTSKGPKMHSSFKYIIGNCCPKNYKQFPMYQDMGFGGCQLLILFKLFRILSSSNGKITCNFSFFSEESRNFDKSWLNAEQGLKAKFDCSALYCHFLIFGPPSRVPFPKKLVPGPITLVLPPPTLVVTKICLACLGCLLRSPLSAVSNIWLSFCRHKSIVQNLLLLRSFSYQS